MGAQFPGHRMTVGDAEKSQQSHITSTFFNTVHLLLKKLRWEHGGTNLLLAPDANWPRYASAVRF